MPVTVRGAAGRLLAVLVVLALVVLAAPARAQRSGAREVALDSLTAGLNFTCGLTGDGRALCWGEHKSGQLGAGAVDAECALVGRSTLPCARGPVEVAGHHHFVAIRAGSDHACGIDRDGDTWCWGVGYFSPLVAERESQICRVPRGDGEKQQVPCSREPAPMPRLAREAGMLPPHMRAVSGGAGMTCGSDASGDVWCWSNYQVAPWRVLVGRPATTVAAGGSTACALTIEGSVRCWEWDGFYVRRLTTVLADTGHTAIAVSATQACALDASGVASCWERGESPETVDAEASFERIATGMTQSCGIAEGGALWCWAHGKAPARVHPTLRFTEVTIGAAHACGVTTAHVALCWGANASGQLGDGSYMVSDTPVRVRADGVSPALAMALDLRAGLAGFIGHGGVGLLAALALAFVLRARIGEWRLASFVALGLGALVLYTAAVVGADFVEGGAAGALRVLRPQVVAVLAVLTAYVVARTAVRGWRATRWAAALAGASTQPAPPFDPLEEENGRGRGFTLVLGGWAILALAFVLVASNPPYDHATGGLAVFVFLVAFAINVVLSLVGGAMAKRRLRRFADDGKARMALYMAGLTVLAATGLAALVAISSLGYR